MCVRLLFKKKKIAEIFKMKLYSYSSSVFPIDYNGCMKY